MIFDSKNIKNYIFSKANKRITKTGSPSLSYLILNKGERVYLSVSLTEKPSFSLKILRNPFISICAGVAFDSSRFTLDFQAARCFDENSYWWKIENGHAYYQSGGFTNENKTVTVSVDFRRKEISYAVDGQSVGDPEFMNLTDEEMQQLRPTVQIKYKGDSDDSVELVD